MSQKCGLIFLNIDTINTKYYLELSLYFNIFVIVIVIALQLYLCIIVNVTVIV